MITCLQITDEMVEEERRKYNLPDFLYRKGPRKLVQLLRRILVAVISKILMCDV